MRASVRETPTFFGPEDSPLFGVVHLPVDGEIRGGVIVCGSLGKDHLDSLRGQRLMADTLAARGMLVLRFDYLGCGDSSFGQLRVNSVKEWQESIAYAIEYLVDMGITDISAVALRAGCLLLDDALHRNGVIRRVVYWDPVGTGRRYLREQAAFFKIAVGDDDAPPGAVSIIGARLSEESARDFEALKLGDGSSIAPIHRLVIGRAEGSDSRVTALSADPSSETVLVSGFAQCAQPSRLLAPISFAAVDATTEWLDQRIPAHRMRVDPVYTDSARIPLGDGSGMSVVERIERIEPFSMFAIRSTPEFHSATDLPTVVFFTNANNPHHGPNREWVELARTAAAEGLAALRWDRRGAGESGPPGRDEEVYIYSREGVEDALAATRHALTGASALKLVGVCSGSWYAARAARELGADSVILVNALLWSWRAKKALRVRALPGSDEDIDWEQTPRARLRGRMQALLPAFAWRQLGRTGVAQAPEVLLAPLARQGSAATAILCPRDAKLFTDNRGREALHNLRRASAPPTLVVTPRGDHAAYHQAVLEALRHAVLS